LLEPCPDCGSKVYITSLGGSPLSGAGSWTGICSSCRERKRGRHCVFSPFIEKIKFVVELRKAFPAEISEWEDYDGFIFSWGGTGLNPARKRRLVRRKLVEPVSFEQLIKDFSA
jgi:hypothetical protein